MTVKLNITAIKQFDTSRQDLHKLADDYRELVVTSKNLKDVDVARKTLKNKRLEIANTVKDVVAEVKRQLKEYEAEADDLINIIKPIEDRLKSEHDHIKEEEEKRYIQKLRNDENRKRAIRDKITLLETKLSSIDKTSESEVLEKLIQDIVADNFNYQEFGDEAQMLKEKIRLDSLKKIGEINRLREEAYETEMTYLDSLRQKMDKVKREDDDKPIELPKPSYPVVTPEKVRENKMDLGLMSTVKDRTHIKPKEYSQNDYHWVSYGKHEFGFSKTMPFKVIADIRKTIIDILIKSDENQLTIESGKK